MTELVADCVFCKIVRGEIPSFKIYEDDRTLAFMDINPANPGHALVVPKFHTPNVLEAPEDWLASTILATRKVARAVWAAVEPDGMNVAQATGPGAVQSVQHLHFHVLPRRMNDGLSLNWGIVPGNMDEIAALAEKIRAHME